jgi:hypothetical protein
MDHKSQLLLGHPEAGPDPAVLDQGHRSEVGQADKLYHPAGIPSEHLSPRSEEKPIQVDHCQC